MQNSISTTLSRQQTNEVLPSMLLTDPRKFWQMINRSPQDSIKLEDNDINRVSDRLCPDSFNAAFASVFTLDSLINPAVSSQCAYPPRPDIFISSQGIGDIIDGLQLSSSLCLDGVTSKILKSTKNISSAFLLGIFPQSLSCSNLPQHRRTRLIISIFKKCYEVS